jgi:hypothetical protein
LGVTSADDNRLPLDRLSDAYRVSENEFLALVRAGAERSRVCVGARAVAEAAKVWNAEAYAQFFRSQSGQPRTDDDPGNLDWISEVSEALAGLWNDLAEAYSP